MKTGRKNNITMKLGVEGKIINKSNMGKKEEIKIISLAKYTYSKYKGRAWPVEIYLLRELKKRLKKYWIFPKLSSVMVQNPDIKSLPQHPDLSRPYLHPIIFQREKILWKQSSSSIPLPSYVTNISPSSLQVPHLPAPFLSNVSEGQ